MPVTTSTGTAVVPFRVPGKQYVISTLFFFYDKYKNMKEQFLAEVFTLRQKENAPNKQPMTNPAPETQNNEFLLSPIQKISQDSFSKKGHSKQIYQQRGFLPALSIKSAPNAVITTCNEKIEKCMKYC